MHRQEAAACYSRALKNGQRCYRSCVHQGRYPYPQVLEEILSDTLVAGYVELGLLDIPLGQVEGTKTVGRRSAFAANFMPLLDPHTEFAEKWISLCQAHLGDTGIRDPVRCYEYMGRFYVQEGNKRVSVLKSFGAVTVPAYVTRAIPVWSEETAVQVYYEFLDFYRLSRVYRVRFTQPGGFAKLQAALGFDPGHVWTEEERRSFLSDFAVFQRSYYKLGGARRPATTAEALLVWLGLYPLQDLRGMDTAALEKSLRAIWPDVTAAGRGGPIAVTTQSELPEKKGLGRLVDSVLLPNHLNAAFVYDHPPEQSPWLRDHERGRVLLEQTMGDTVTAKTYLTEGEDPVAVMERAVAEGAQVLVAPTPPLIAPCRRLAAGHPQLRVLNCSVAMPYPGVRTYHGRMYEGAFIAGAAAGAVAAEDTVGYLAENPLFGTPASINAFALGVRLTNPRGRVALEWSCLPGDPVARLRARGVRVVFGRSSTGESSGRCLFRLTGEREEPLLLVDWVWGSVYIRLMRSILHGGWDSLSAGDKAVNYWWGLDSGAITVSAQPALPDGVAALTGILRQGVAGGEVSPFHRKIRSQDGEIRNDGRRWFGPEEILYLDWLCDTVEGEIPPFDRLTDQARPRMRLQGIYRQSIPPEMEGPLL